MDRSINMTSGNPARLILRLAVPLILTSLGQQLYGIVDAIIVGRGVGVSAFASLGACDWLYWMVLWSVQALTQGFSTLISRNFGAGDNKALQRSYSMCIKLCVIIGAVITAASVVFANPLLHLLNTPADIFGGASVYLRTMYMGTLIVMGYNMAAAILRSTGDGKTPLIAMCTAGVLNILLDLLFVIVFKWGIIGAAAATLMAQFIALLYCLVILKRSALFHPTKEERSWDSSSVKELLRLGIPLVFSSIVVVIGGILAQSVINSNGGVFVAGCTAANKLHGTLDCSAVALGFAASTYIGQNYGAKKLDRVKKGIKQATVISLIIGLSITAFMFIFGRSVVGLFLAKEVENAAQALDVAYNYTMVMSAMLAAAYVMNLYRYSLQALGNSRDPMISGFFELGARVFVAYVFPLFLGSYGLFFMDGSAWAAAGAYQVICFCITFRRRENALMKK